MEKPKLPPEMMEVLTTGHFAYLCTTDKNNQPHVTPMFYLFDEKTDALFVTASSGSKKMQNIQVNPKISLAIDIRDAVNPFNNRGVMVQGKAVVEKPVDALAAGEDDTLIEASKAFQEKYPVLQEAPDPAIAEAKKFSENLIRIVPKRMVYWRGPNFITVNFDKPGISYSPTI
jgi:nitroimidazol reductase NimA-like FMN-containing flavoprotein (pyridoxamine 5'-phosphate oxidase superfamily)